MIIQTSAVLGFIVLFSSELKWKNSSLAWGRPRRLHPIRPNQWRPSG